MSLIILFMNDLTLPDSSLSTDNYSQVGARGHDSIAAPHQHLGVGWGIPNTAKTTRHKSETSYLIGQSGGTLRDTASPELPPCPLN